MFVTNALIMQTKLCKAWLKLRWIDDFLWTPEVFCEILLSSTNYYIYSFFLEENTWKMSVNI